MNKGFTLIELLVLIALVGILITIVIVSIVGQEQGKIQICQGNNCIIVDKYRLSEGCAITDDETICGNFTIKKEK
uniref:Putative methyltransferase n=1 Tax=viral metagenome TaxID=1070528 RepID=A0A6H1ZFV0_9ZZZZ